MNEKLALVILHGDKAEEQLRECTSQCLRAKCRHDERMKPFYKAVHARSPWRGRQAHDDRQSAINGPLGAVCLLEKSGPRRQLHEQMHATHGPVLAVFVWYPSDELADVRRIGSDGRLQAARVPVAYLDAFQEAKGSGPAAIGPSESQITDWLQRFAVDPAAPLAPDPEDGYDAESPSATAPDPRPQGSDAPAEVDPASDRSDDEGFLYPDEHFEGEGKQVVVNAYERDQGARRACIARYGPVCQACDLDFESVYGDIGRDFIHVHHLVALASGGGVARRVDGVRDLRPVCPNCHAMLHRTEPSCSIGELRERMAAAAEGRARKS
ncbi:HNH endonuclease [Variovorax paradoxus]|uniref:HNH endonuclease n=1 Tax=Variovorax paradoxus TaxID=34073 RepID=UPI0039994F46